MNSWVVFHFSLVFDLVGFVRAAFRMWVLTTVFVMLFSGVNMFFS